VTAGYYPSPWPAEDGGPRRLQVAERGSIAAGLGLQSGERLACVTRRTTLSTMTVLGDPGEVYLLTHSAIRAKLGLPTTSCVELLHPETLQTLARSPRLPGGPMWPGGMALHRNGGLYVVYGRYLHRLDRACQPLMQWALPLDLPYNSFVILDNGLIVTKNLSDTVPARLTVMDPDRCQPAGPDVTCPEPSIARLSAVGNTVYVVGVRTVFRYHWSAQAGRLERDTAWQWEYLAGTAQSWGWDLVLEGTQAWFMDNGRHRYLTRMVGAGVHRTPNRLLRVSLSQAQDHQAWDICGLPGGSITNPPLVDVQRRVVVGYDAANKVMQAWRIEPESQGLTPLWQRSNLGCASHMLLFSATGELVTNDYRRWGEEVVVLDIETGIERARVRVGGLQQGVVFPSVGWGRDFYWCSMSKVARVYVR